MCGGAGVSIWSGGGGPVDRGVGVCGPGNHCLA